MSGSNSPLESMDVVRMRYTQSQERAMLRREALRMHRRRMRRLRFAMLGAAVLLLVCAVVVVMAHT